MLSVIVTKRYLNVKLTDRDWSILITMSQCLLLSDHEL